MRRIIAGVVCSLVGVTAAADVMDAAAGGFGIQHERAVALAPDAAWTAFVDDVGQWWNADHTWFGDAGALSIDARAGGCFCERSTEGSVAHLEVGMAWPGRKLGFLGGLGPLQPLGVSGAMTIDFEAAEGGGSRIHLLYRVSGHAAEGLEPWAGPVDGVLAEQLDRFVAYAAGLAARD